MPRFTDRRRDERDAVLDHDKVVDTELLLDALADSHKVGR
jgi:hypothetical protein